MAKEAENNKSEDPIDQIECYGSATLGERGQVVIPAELRDKLEVEPGDKLIAFSTPMGSVMFVSAQKFEDKIEKWDEKLKNMKNLSN